MDVLNFFENLSKRLYSENNLSDITWAFMMSCEKFKDVFLEFCFESPVPDVRDIKREFVSNKSRPDFHFYDARGIEYLIEIKIYDRNQHFDPYNKKFPKAKKSFLSNYHLMPNEYMPDSQTWKKKNGLNSFYI